MYCTGEELVSPMAEIRVEPNNSKKPTTKQTVRLPPRILTKPTADKRQISIPDDSENDDETDLPSIQPTSNAP
jgi:hypothetical protein